MRAKADPNLQNKDGDTPLHLSVLKADIKMVSTLLKCNANPNVKNLSYGQTALHYAVNLENGKIAEMMIAYDASPLIKDKCGKTAMDLATATEIQRVLVEPPRIEPESPKLPEPVSDNSDEETVIKIPEIIFPVYE